MVVLKQVMHEVGYALGVSTEYALGVSTEDAGGIGGQAAEQAAEQGGAEGGKRAGGGGKAAVEVWRGGLLTRHVLAGGGLNGRDGLNGSLHLLFEVTRLNGSKGTALSVRATDMMGIALNGQTANGQTAQAPAETVGSTAIPTAISMANSTANSTAMSTAAPVPSHLVQPNLPVATASAVGSTDSTSSTDSSGTAPTASSWSGARTFTCVLDDGGEVQFPSAVGEEVFTQMMLPALYRRLGRLGVTTGDDGVARLGVMGEQ
jgi:hypothetical protein